MILASCLIPKDPTIACSCVVPLMQEELELTVFVQFNARENGMSFKNTPNSICSSIRRTYYIHCTDARDDPFLR